MTIQRWSETVLGAELHNDPAFSQDVEALIEELAGRTDADVVLDLSNVRYLNSSNITKLLKLSKVVIVKNQRAMKLCAVPSSVLGVFRISGLEKSFEFAPDIRAALAAFQRGS